jgi:DNA repair protein RadD
MTPTLRPYQLVAVELVRSQLRAGKRRPILVCPTGSGKTITAVHILISALGKGKRVGFAAHRKELIDQTVSTFARLGVTDVSVVRAKDRRYDPRKMVQIASVQTLARREVIPGVDVWVIDECHRALAETYLKYLFMAYPTATFLGLTATPIGPSGKPMGAAFDSLVIGARYSELISGGHIVEPVVYSTPTQADLSGVRTVGGDYNVEDLEKAVNKGALIGNLVEEWRKHAQGRRTVVFAVSVAHSMAIRDRFLAMGVPAEHLDGSTPDVLRENVLSRLGSGESSVVVNVGVLCEGWDQPSCKCIVLARPTKSLTLYMQMAGRALRPWNGIVPIILDHGGNLDRHLFPTLDREWSLTTKPKRTSEVAPMRVCKSCYAYIAASCKTCPHCEAISVPSREEKKAQDTIDVALAKRSQEEIVKATPLPPWCEVIEDDKVGRTFKALVRKMVALNYKPGWVSLMFQQIFRRRMRDEWWDKLEKMGKKAA